MELGKKYKNKEIYYIVNKYENKNKKGYILSMKTLDDKWCSHYHLINLSNFNKNLKKLKDLFFDDIRSLCILI